MKIEIFSTLDAVLRNGSLAAAAAEMNLTASAVSMQMKQLEAYLGQPLFDRSSHSLQPTTLAYDVAAALRDGLHQLQALRRRTQSSVEGVVRLGVIESMLPTLLPGTLTRLRARYPRLQVRPLRGRSVGLTDAVKSGELDAALVAEPERGGSVRLRWHALLRSELRLIAPPDAPQAGVTALFRAHDWIRYDRQSISGALAARYVARHVRTQRGALELDSILAVVAMVSAGLGVALVHLPDVRICHSYPVRFVPAGRDVPVMQTSLVTRQADAELRTLAAVREAMIATLAETVRAGAPAAA